MNPFDLRFIDDGALKIADARWDNFSRKQTAGKLNAEYAITYGAYMFQIGYNAGLADANARIKAYDLALLVD